MLIYNEQDKELINNGKVIFKFLDVFKRIKIFFHQEFVIINPDGTGSNIRIYDSLKNKIYSKGTYALAPNGDYLFFTIYDEENEKEMLYYKENRFDITKVQNFNQYQNLVGSSSMQYSQYNVVTCYDIIEELNKLFVINVARGGVKTILCDKLTEITQLLKIFYYRKSSDNKYYYFKSNENEAKVHLVMKVNKDKKVIDKFILNGNTFENIYTKQKFEIEKLFPLRKKEFVNQTLEINMFKINDLISLSINKFGTTTYWQTCSIDLSTNKFETYNYPNNVSKFYEHLETEKELIIMVKENYLNFIIFKDNEIYYKKITDDKYHVGNTHLCEFSNEIVGFSTIIGTGTEQVDCGMYFVFEDNKMRMKQIDKYFTRALFIENNKFYMDDKVLNLKLDNYTHKYSYINWNKYFIDEYFKNRTELKKVDYDEVMFLYNVTDGLSLRYILIKDNKLLFESDLFFVSQKRVTNQWSHLPDHVNLLKLIEETRNLNEEQLIEFSLLEKFS